MNGYGSGMSAREVRDMREEWGTRDVHGKAGEEERWLCAGV